MNKFGMEQHYARWPSGYLVEPIRPADPLGSWCNRELIKTKNKILFLGVDGVLNLKKEFIDKSDQKQFSSFDIDPELLENLNKLANEFPELGWCLFSDSDLDPFWVIEKINEAGFSGSDNWVGVTTRSSRNHCGERFLYCSTRTNANKKDTCLCQKNWGTDKYPESGDIILDWFYEWFETMPFTDRFPEGKIPKQDYLVIVNKLCLKKENKIHKCNKVLIKNLESGFGQVALEEARKKLKQRWCPQSHYPH
jgi:hypothetical protein